MIAQVEEEYDAELAELLRVNTQQLKDIRADVTALKTGAPAPLSSSSSYSGQQQQQPAPPSKSGSAGGAGGGRGGAVASSSMSASPVSPADYAARAVTMAAQQAPASAQGGRKGVAPGKQQTKSKTNADRVKENKEKKASEKANPFSPFAIAGSSIAPGASGRPSALRRTQR